MSTKNRERAAGRPSGKERLDRARGEIAARVDPLLAQVVSDPLRLQMIITATSRKVSAGEFAVEWDIPESATRYHLKFLEQRGFVEVVEKVQRRGAWEAYYRSTKQAFISDTAWAALSALVQDGVSRTIVEELYARIVAAAEADTLDSRSDSILWWQEVPLNEITFGKGMGLMRALIEELTALGEETARTSAEGEGGEVFTGVFSLMGFEAAGDGTAREGGPAEESGWKTGPNGT